MTPPLNLADLPISQTVVQRVLDGASAP
jgi:hypothetical protein